MSEYWKQIQSAVWLIGLAILAWQDWWWPGILVLVAISGVTQALIKRQVDKESETAAAKAKAQAQQESEAARRIKAASLLPPVCPHCGAPVTPEKVHWNGPNKATCAYCDAPLPLVEPEDVKHE
jgi:hypothetical protein